MVCLACTCIYLSFKSESTSRHQWFFRENACIIEKVACSHIVTGIQNNVIASQYSGKTIPYIMIIQKGHVIYATLILIKYEYMYKVSTQKKNSQQCTTCTKIYAVFHPFSVDISINRKNIIAHFLHMYHKRFVSICEDIKVKGTNYQYRRN